MLKSKSRRVTITGTALLLCLGLVTAGSSMVSAGAAPAYANLIYLPGLPLWCGLVIALAARNSALLFTKWYPERQRAKFATSATSTP